MDQRMAGHNVIQLFYQIQSIPNSKSIEQSMDELISEKSNWRKLTGDIEEKPRMSDAEAFDASRRVFPAVYFCREKGQFADSLDGFDSRGWISSDTFHGYFHPSVQQSLFHSETSPIRYALSLIRSDATTGYPGELFLGRIKSIPKAPVLFEHVASELTVFSDRHAVLMVRVCLLENHVATKGLDPGVWGFRRNLSASVAQNCSLQLWMKFADTIRCVHKKYETQERIDCFSVTLYSPASPSKDTGDDMVRVSVDPNDIGDWDQQKLFVNHVLKSLPNGVMMSDVKPPKVAGRSQPSGLVKDFVEPNAFIHSYIQWDMKPGIESTEMNERELFALLSVDGGLDGSGTDSDFIRNGVRDHSIRRWAPANIFTAIDYACVTIVQSSPCYLSSEAGWRFHDLTYQHHARQYMWFVLMQLFYRGELHDLSGQYSEVRVTKEGSRSPGDWIVKVLGGTEKGVKNARAILNEYYNLNQKFFFTRVTNEVQGAELWRHYQEVMGISELYRTVKEDMRELNQRLIENNSDRQATRLLLLTVLSVLLGLAVFLGSGIGFGEGLRITGWVLAGIATLGVLGVLFVLVYSEV